MFCEKCGSEVPPNKLICDCFQVSMDQEIESRGLHLFVQGGPLYLTETQTDRHLLPRRLSKGILTLCHKKRYKTHTDNLHPITRLDFEKLQQKDVELMCPACIDVVAKTISAAKATR